MKDPRIQTLAKNLINYSCKVKPGDKVLIESYDVGADLASALIKEAYAVGGQPFVWMRDTMVNRALLMEMGEEQADVLAEHESQLMKQMQAYIGIRGAHNSYEQSDVPAEQHELYAKRVSSKVHSGIRVPQTNWVVLRYPSPSMAQQAAMSTEAFEDYYFNVCCLDYAKMGEAMKPLIRLMEKTDRVRIVGQGTDLSFSIQGIPVIPCAGECNIPDGEIYTAPVRDSINGVLKYNTPAVYQGFTFENIEFTFENGKIVKAAANDTERINKVLDTDEGARYVGEFAIGVNPYITQAMKDTLFDEKIAGSFHFTPGRCYDEASNGNHSAIHWDLVCIQTLEYGGGEMYFDGVLVRKDGRFMLPELDGLNPENLK